MFNEIIVDSTEKVIIRSLIEAANTDSQGLVTENVMTKFIKELTPTERQIFSKTINDSTYMPIYSGVKVFIDSDDQSVIFRKKDALIFNGFFEMNYEVNADEE